MPRFSGSYPLPAAARSGSPGEARSERLRPRSLPQRVLGFFKRSVGDRLSTRNVDLRYWFWKRSHAGSSFADYYARSIAAKLAHGGTHKTLLSRKNRLASAAVLLAQDSPERQRRDLNYFALATQNGLRPEHVCIDYGCGSLRVGRYLIGYLEPGHYWGLDIVSDFYEAGMALLPPRMIDDKQPELHVVGVHSVLAARQAEPDFVFSFAVLKHVPPEELETYFANITALMGPKTTALITFTEAGATSRTGSKIWEQSPEDLAASVRRQGAGFVCTVRARKPNAPLPRKSVLTIRRVGMPSD
jgi:hypothetical protein